MGVTSLIGLRTSLSRLCVLNELIEVIRSLGRKARSLTELLHGCVRQVLAGISADRVLPTVCRVALVPDGTPRGGPEVVLGLVA